MNKNTNVGSLTRGFVAFCTALVALFTHAAEVTKITTQTHYPWNGKVDVTYTVAGIEAGSEYRVSAIVRAGGQDYDAFAVTNTANGTYSFTWDAAAAGFVGRVEDAKVVFTVAEPNFAVIDLSAGSTATKYPVSYLVDAGDYASNDEYKTNKLLLKRVGRKYVGVFEVTQKQYELVTGSNPSYFTEYADKSVEAKRPVERLSYDEIVGVNSFSGNSFFDILERRTRPAKDLPGLPIGLPTEGEWQYVATNGMTGTWSPASKEQYDIGEGLVKGDDATYRKMGRYIDLWEVDSGNPNGYTKTVNGNGNPNRYTDAAKGTAVVGSYNANLNGLYDMHGNVAEWTKPGDPSAGVYRLCGGSWQEAGADCGLASSRPYDASVEASLYRCGFRVFGDAVKIEEGFVHQTTAESSPFAVDVDSDNIRQVRVADNGGAYAFFYTPEGGEEIDWVKLTDLEDWYPTKSGDNVATHPSTGETATFRVKALEIEIKAYPVTVTYDGEGHTIKGPTVVTPPAKFDVVYWCSDKEGQATENEATDEKIYFTDVKRDPNDNSVLPYAIWYKVTSAFYTTKAECQQLTINPRAIKAAQVRFGDTLTYNGKVQTNKVTSVTMTISNPAKTLTLEEGTDYTVVDNWGTDAKRYTATFSGIGNYSGTRTEAWEILPLDFGNITPDGSGSGTQEKKAAKVNLVSDNHGFVYNGHEQTNTVLSVSINGEDFTPTSGSFGLISGNRQTDAGTYQIVVRGTKNFKGELTNSWTIAKLPITNATVYLDAEFDYNGDCQTRHVTNVTVATAPYTIPVCEPAIPAPLIVPSYTIDVPAANYVVSGNTGTNASAKVGAYTLGVTTFGDAQNFCEGVTTNWFIGQRDLTNAVFTVDEQEACDYVYNRTGKTPDATAKDRDSETVPTITPTTNLVAGVINDWTIAKYLDNVNVGDNAKIVFAATENGNYRGVVTNGFSIDVSPAAITSVTVKAECKCFIYDGTEKEIHSGDVDVWANGLQLVPGTEYEMSTQNKATDSGRYKVTAAPQTANFINTLPNTAYDTWVIVPAAPVLTWTTPKGAQFVTNENGIVLFGVSDLTVAALARCEGKDKLNYKFETLSGNEPIVSGDKFHVTERTKITAFSTFDVGDGTVLTGAETTVELVPGQCADPKIYIKPGTAGYVAADKFNRNNTFVTIEPTETVNGVKVRDWPNDPFWPAWENETNEYRRLYYSLYGKDNSLISASNDYAKVGLKVSADTVIVEAWMHDTSTQYLDSVHVATNLVREIDTKLPAPVISIVTNSVGSRTVTIADAVANAMIYFTTNYAVCAAAEAIRPAGPMEISRSQADRDATVKYTGPFSVWLDKDVSFDIKAIAYTNLTADAGDFVARSEVAEMRDVREWVIGDALNCPDQVFTNGWNQVDVPQVDDPKPGTATDWGKSDVPWYVTNTTDNANGECMRSGPLTNGNIRTSSISTTVKGAGYIVFRWRANCEDDPTGETWDHGEFILDGVITNKIDGVTTNAAGGVVWETVALKVTNGTHKLTWSYTKDFSKHGVGIEEGDDCVYLDSFVFTPALAFGEFEVTVDPLVFNNAAQLPTNEVLASGIKTNYVHASVKEPSTGITLPIEEGVDFEVTGTAGFDAKDYVNELKLKALDGSFLVKGETNVTWKILPLDLTGGEVQVDQTAFTYTGSAQTVNVTNLWARHYRDGLISVKDAASWSPNSATETDQGSYTLQVIGTDNLAGNAPVVNWSIGQKPFADDISITFTPEAITYLEATPTVTVRDTARGVELTEDADYKLAWPADIVNVGTKTVTVTGMGNYGGQSKEATYRITQRNISAGTITPTYTTVTYNGIPWRNDIKVKNDLGSNLVEGVDYKYVGDSRTQTNAGTYTNKIEGINNYWSTKEITWTIKPIDLPSANLTLVPATYSFEYDGTGKKVQTADVKSAKVGKLAIKGYTVACDEKTEKGDYTFTVTSTDPNFDGTSQPQNWSIGARSLTNAVITLTTNLIWNGVVVYTNEGTRLVRTVLANATEQTMTFDVFDGEKKLQLGTDYEIVSGTDRGTDAGKYLLQINGLGNYASSISTSWVIAPSLVTIAPNAEDPTTNEVVYVSSDSRIQMERDIADWILRSRRTKFNADGTIKSQSTGSFRSFNIKERIRLDGWAITQDGVTGSVRTVDFRLGCTADPVVVLADTNNVPYLYEDGTPWTNSVGAVITNFCHNGQLVALTRGNVVVSNLVDGTRKAYTNDADNAIYTDGVLRYTIDGTEPTAESPAWTADARIAITNTTTVIAKVFGGQFMDSPSVTNVFVREFEGYAPPEVTYFNRAVEPQDWTLATNGETVAFNQIGQRVKIADTNLVGGAIYYSTNNLATTNAYDGAELVFDRTTTLTAWIGDKFDVHNYADSAFVTVCFDRDKQLAMPNIAFTNDAELVAFQYENTNFSNAYQKVMIWRDDLVGTKYADGKIVYTTNDWATTQDYTAPFVIWGTTTVKAKATGGVYGYGDSETNSVAFTQHMAALDDLVVTVTNAPTVKQAVITITNNTGNAVYYTLDGSDPIGVNPAGVKRGHKFAETFKTFTYDMAIGETLVVKAIAYAEVTDGKDYVAVSEVAEDSVTRNWSIGDAIKPDAPEKQAAANQPDTSDMMFDNSDNEEYYDDRKIHDWTNTAWVVDTDVYVSTNAQGKGSSMRSGAARTRDPMDETSYSTLRTTVRGPGTISFKWKSSTEFDVFDPAAMWDFGTFYVDGEEKAHIWGTNDWKEVTFTIEEDGAGASDHEIVWEYTKDWTDLEPEELEELGIEDCIWVDDFVWTCVPDMKQCDVSVSPLTYSQGMQVPTVAVTNRTTGAELTRGVDYDYTVNGQRDAGTYTLTVFGLGTTYTGSNEVQWTIAPLSIDNAVVRLSGGQVYTRDANGPVEQRAKVENIYVDAPNVGRIDVVFDKAWSLDSGTTNATEAGTYEITLAGSDNLTGSVTTNWVIAPRPITADMITVPTDIVYFGGETNVTASADFKVVYEGEEIVWENAVGNLGTNAATYTVTVSAVTNATLKDYTGIASKDWTIAPFDFDRYGSLLALTNETFVYNGYEQTNEVDYVLGMHPVFGAVAFSNDTWWVSNNVQTVVGEYWAYLYPEGDANFCGGPISNRWQIVPYDKEVDVAFGPWPVYDGGATELSPTITSVTTVPGGLTLVEGRDYTVEYASKDLQNRKYALKGTLTIVGKGNFYGLRKENVAFEILPEQIENTTIDLADWSYVYDGAEKVPGIKMTLPNGKPVKMDQSPQKDGKKIGGWMILDGSMTNGTNAGSYPINIKGYYDYTETADTPYTGNIAGETNVTWKIERLNLTDPSVTITLSAESFVYNRQVQQPAVTVTCNGKTIPADDIVLDFTDVDCSNACDAITFKVKGSGVNVTNEVEKSYKITPAQITGIKFVAQPGKPWVCTYDGKAHSPKVAEVSAEGGLTLTVDEYELTDVGKVDVGEYTSAVTSKSRNFSDPAVLPSAKWKIAPKSIEGAEVVVTFGRPLVYNGQPQMIDDVKDITVTVGDLTVDGVKFDCPEHADAGSYDDAVVTATGKNFTGSHAVQWTIEQRDITAATIVWENARLLWNGQEGVPAKEQTPVIKAITVGGPDLEAGETIEFKGTAAVLTVDDGNKTEAGRYASTVTGTKNFKGTTTQAQTWEIVPKAPLITPNDGTGKYTKLADYVTVEINNNTSNQLWSICYTTNGWAETKTYPVKGGKWDIEGHTVVEAYAVSCDGLVTGETARCEYFFGKRNVAPTIGLTALDGAEADRPSPWPKDNTEVKGAAKLIVTDNDNVHTNFFHGKTKVYLTRFGAMTQAEIDQTIKDSTTDKGLCPYLDGEIWYTVATGGMEIIAPTNATGFGSTLFETNNPASWPTISTNAVIVARVFGDQLESSAEVTNVFQRLWTTMPKPEIVADKTTFHTNVIISITTNTLDTADWTYTNDNQKIWITVGDKTPFLYTNAFELTWKDCTDEEVTVKAVSKYGEDYLDSEADEQTFTHEKKAFAMPTMTESTVFRHSSPAFTVSLTNNAPLGVGGELTYSINGSDPIPCGADNVPTYVFSITTTSVVRVWVEANGDAHDYCNSATNEATYTYSPYKMVAPTFDKDSQTFYDKDFEYTVNYPTRGVAEDADHIYDGGVISYSTDDGKNWTAIAKTDLPKTFKTSETVTVMVKQTLEDHLDSDVVTRTFTRDVKTPTIELVNEDGTPAYVETPAGATNYFHKAFVAMSCVGGDTRVEYTIEEVGQSKKGGTYADKLPVADTFTVTAVAKSAGGSESAPVTATYTRKWETLVQPKITLIDPSGDSGDEFWNTGDRIAITNDETAVAEHTAVLWPTNFTVKYAVYTNSNDTTTVPTDWAEFVQGVTTNFFKADTNAVWAIVEADDYLPSTNAVSFIRQFTEIGGFTEDMVHFDSPETRYEVDVTFDNPFAANAIYYTYEITNEEAGVSTPWGNEYDVTKSSARYEGAFKVAIKPRQTLIVKARAYWEDESSALVGVAETNFVSRGEVVVGKYTLPWTIADALDFPDPETPFTVQDSLAKKGNTNCVEDTENYTTGGSSMVFKNLVDNETVTIETMVTGPGTVTFDWRTSCEQGGHGYNHDYLAFSVDGTEVARLDGESGWTNVTFKIDGALGDVHFLQWSYKKDAAESKYADCAWVDNFTWTSGLQKSDITDDLKTWFQAYEPYPGYYDTMLADGDLANWKEALGMDSAVTGRSYWDCYVLGLDPDDWETDFVAGAPVIETTVDTEGKTVPKSVTITWTPCTKAGRTYSLVGKKDFALDADWTILATLNATAEDPAGGSIKASLLNDANKDYQFFQLRVRMTK